MATTLNSSGVLFPDSTTQTSAIGLNRIINGGMTIDQRNLGVIKIPNSGDYCLDRYFYSCTASSKASVQQQSLAPNGFTNSLRVNTLSAHTVGVTILLQYVSQLRVQILLTLHGVLHQPQQ